PAEALAAVRGEMSALLSSPAAIRALPPPVADGVAASLELAIQAVFFWAVPIAVLGFALSWYLREIPLRDTVGPATLAEGAEGGVGAPPRAATGGPVPLVEGAE
ncbi:MAG: hypothetical protein OXH04_18235, partial [Acidobacteria bacterium]|nr:hypothetical protein [Acidobacteriota bacterium]